MACDIPFRPGDRVVADSPNITPRPGAPMTVEGIDPDGMVACRHDFDPERPAPWPDGMARWRYRVEELRLA